MSYEQGRISNLLIECLEDSLERRKDIIKAHSFFMQTRFDRIDVLFFPLSLIAGNQKYEHLHPIEPKDRYWNSDEALIKYNHLGIRIVFDDSALLEAFQETNDCSIESDLCKEFLERLNSFYADDDFEKISAEIDKTKIGSPRFKMFKTEKLAAFPDFINVYKPKDVHFC